MYTALPLYLHGCFRVRAAASNVDIWNLELVPGLKSDATYMSLYVGIELYWITQVSTYTPFNNAFWNIH